MITIDGKILRNLEEQVLKNQQDITNIKSLGQLYSFDIKVVGQVTDITDLPNPETYQGEFGDAYLVGTTLPYDFYIYTRPNQFNPTNFWLNIGPFPLAGPQGETGPAGPASGATLLKTLTGVSISNDSSLNSGCTIRNITAASFKLTVNESFNFEEGQNYKILIKYDTGLGKTIYGYYLGPSVIAFGFMVSPLIGIFKGSSSDACLSGYIQNNAEIHISVDTTLNISKYDATKFEIEIYK